MKIVAQRIRAPHLHGCYKCGVMFECEKNDIIEEKLTDSLTVYSVKCPQCSTKLLLGKDLDKIFPWVE